MATYTDLVVNVASGNTTISITTTIYTVPAGRRAEVTFMAQSPLGTYDYNIQGVTETLSAAPTKFETLRLDAGDSIQLVKAAGNANYAFTAFEYTN